MKYLIILEETRTGFSAYAPDLPGCVAAGESAEETEELMRQAIQVHLEGMRADGEPIPPPHTRAAFVEVVA